VSKTVERAIDIQFTSYSNKNSLFPVYQSAYRTHQSTETAVACIYNDLVSAIDQGHVGALVLLDLSSAFDTVDHDAMMNVLRQRFGIENRACDWFRSYFEDRKQVVCIQGNLTCSVPQGSVLGPKAFLAYAEDVADIFTAHQL
jgi:Reverse transcriptase (RNA-dependent DNA polymerase)